MLQLSMGDCVNQSPHMHPRTAERYDSDSEDRFAITWPCDVTA